MGHLAHRPQVICLLLALALTGLTSCSTAPVALEQANHTVGLMSLLDNQLTEFRRVQAAAQEARLDSLRRQKATLVRVDETATLNAQASKSAGDTMREQFAKKLLDDADGLAAVKSRSQAKATADADKLNSLLTPQPSTTASIAGAQTKAALLGRELDSKVRFEELQSFLNEVAESVKKNRKRIADAEADAAKATAAAASSPTPMPVSESTK